MKEKKLSTKSKIKTLTSDHKAITLIALIITIIVMLILVGVTVNVAINGGLFSAAKQATTDTQYHADREMLLSSVIGAMNNDAEVDFNKLDENLPDGFKKADDGGYTSEAGNTFYVDKNGNITDEKVVTPEPTGPQVTADGKTETLTRDNVADYLGRVVTNYAGKSSVEIGDKTYTVSTQYRLYYVDFDNKYGDGAGTAYLKAECTGSNYSLQKTDPKETDVVKIENLNPGLYNKEDKDGFPIPSEEETPPNESQDNMKAVKWLTNTNNWAGLADESMLGNINYIVGAPSLEMMMDSYNTHYKLKGDEKVTTSDLQNNQDARVKLYYQYPYEDDSNHYGYGVKSANAIKYNNSHTSNYSVKTDKIDSMYYPGKFYYYWLASPSAYGTKYVLTVYYDKGGYVRDDDYSYLDAFCPLVSLKSSVNLTLE